MTKVFFFCGSSSVGKTTTLKQLDPNRFQAIHISARDVRARLDNPSWDDLMTKSDLAKYHQQYILDSYIASINYEVELHKEHKNPRIMVFERSLWDVIGYSYAYKCDQSFIDEQVEEVIEFEEQLVSNVAAQIVRFPISQAYSYEAIPERPPESVRDLCDDWLNDNWHRSHIADLGFDRLKMASILELQSKMLGVNEFA